MNQIPNDGQNGGDNFANTGAESQTNPFTADLKGEFTSTFDTNTNPVSQIFREGGFGGQDRTRNIVLAVVGVVLVGVVAWLFLQNDDPTLIEEPDIPTIASEPPDLPDLAAVPEPPAPPATPSPAVTPEPDPEPPTIAEEPEPPSAPEPAGLSEPPADPVGGEPSYSSEGGSEYATDTGYVGGGVGATLISPPNGAVRDYDESRGPAEISWDGSPGGWILFSKHPDMQPVERRAPVSGNSYQYYHPFPGTWYWMVRNGGGSSEIRSFTISPPAKRNLAVSAPQSGGAVAGNGGVVSWQGDDRVAYYRLEISNGDWANPQYRFATSGNSLQLQGVQPGSYELRVGGFSEVSGRWEFSQPFAVTVQ